MQEFTAKTAVVTGAASGIGRSLAQHCASEGMRVVLADVDEAGLDSLRQELAERGCEVRSVSTDVSDAAQVEALRDHAIAAFGGVDLLFNNAGVLMTGYCWERTEQDWAWILGVNLWGVIHGIRAFVPSMIERGTPAHVVNTASVAAFSSGPFLGPYTASKHAVVGISETLQLDLMAAGAPVRVSCLCPAAVETGIMNSRRIRPRALSETRALEGEIQRAIHAGIEAHMEQGAVDPGWIAARPSTRFARIASGSSRTKTSSRRSTRASPPFALDGIPSRQLDWSRTRSGAALSAAVPEGHLAGWLSGCGLEHGVARVAHG